MICSSGCSFQYYIDRYYGNYKPGYKNQKSKPPPIKEKDINFYSDSDDSDGGKSSPAVTFSIELSTNDAYCICSV